MLKRTSSVFLGVLLLAALAVNAQQSSSSPASGASSSPQEVPTQSSPSATLKVTARVVVLDVVVTDKKGKAVHRDLSRDDFTVLEGNAPQRILSFEPPASHQMPASNTAIVHSASDLKSIGTAPVTILVLDELNSRFEDMSFSRQMMVKYLQSQPAVLKEPTVLMLASNTTFQQLHDYTQDRDELIRVIQKHLPEYPWRMMNSGKSGPGAVERMAQVLGALQQIAEASTGTVGRKNLIWVGNGFPSVDVVTLDTKQADTIESAIRRCTARLLAARVTMYTINPTAESSSTVDAETPDDLDMAMDENGADLFGSGPISFTNFAPSTGGVAFTGRNDLNNVIGEGIAQGQDYYTLSYSPTDKSDDPAKFRNIRIVMKDPNLRAVTRDGYYPATDTTLNPVLDKTLPQKQMLANLKLDLSAALTSTISYNGLNITAKKVDENNYTIHVAENGIGWSDQDSAAPQHSEATVAAGWYDGKGKLIGHVVREESSPRGSGSDGANFQLSVSLPANAARVRFVVRDALNGHMGTVDVAKR